MIYLTTGGNGAGKTLITLKDVRDQQLREGRAVYYHGFTAKQQLTDWGWKEFDPKKWQDLPDGSICVMDECQNEFPAKITDELKKQYGDMPEYINAVAQYRRKRGFDFWMITPHPRLIHLNIRQLIESPSWHRHLKRAFGADMVSEIRFNFANLKCEQPSAGKQGQVSMRAFPKDVYDWYQSASLHTGKRKLPKQAIHLAIALVAVPVLLYAAYYNVSRSVLKSEPTSAKVSSGAGSEGADSSSRRSGAGVQTGMTVAEYVAARTPRIPDFPHTAPAYDEVTKPVDAPYPAACIFAHTRKTCLCYSQQGTILHTSGETCMQIVRNGFFVDWGRGQQQQQVQPRVVNADTVRAQDVKVADMAKLRPVEQQPHAPAVSEWAQALATRNAQVRSNLQ